MIRKERGHGAYWKHMVADRGCRQLLCFAYVLQDGIDALDSCVRIHLQKNQRCPAEATRQIEQHWRPGSSKIV